MGKIGKTVAMVVTGILISAAGNLVADIIKVKYVENKVKKVLDNI